MTEYDPSLIEIRKLLGHTRNLQVGDVVVGSDPLSSRGNRPVRNFVIPGTDRVVRADRVKNSSGEYDRPITKLCLIETEETTPL